MGNEFWDKLVDSVSDFFVPSSPAATPAPAATAPAPVTPEAAAPATRPIPVGFRSRIPRGFTPGAKAPTNQQRVEAMAAGLADTSDWDARAAAMGLPRGDGKSVGQTTAPGGRWKRIVEGTPRQAPKVAHQDDSSAEDEYGDDPYEDGLDSDEDDIPVAMTTRGTKSSKWAAGAALGLPRRAERNKLPWPKDRAFADENSKVYNRTKYLNDAEREAHRLTQKDGRLVFGGQFLDTRNAAATRLKDTAQESDAGKNIFVLHHDAKGGPNLYGADQAAEEEASRASGAKEAFHHTSFLSGADVHGAGEVGAKAGWVQTITNKSGHHRPDEESNLQTALALESMGVNIDAAKVQAVGDYRSWNARAYAATRGDTTMLEHHKDLMSDLATWKHRLDPERRAQLGVEPKVPFGQRAKEEPAVEEAPYQGVTLPAPAPAAGAAPAPEGARGKFNGGWRQYTTEGGVRWHDEGKNQFLDGIEAGHGVTRGGMRVGRDAAPTTFGVTNAKYRGEHEEAKFRPKEAGATVATKYYDDAERDAHAVKVDGEGLLRRAGGDVIDTAGAGKTLVRAEAGRNIFALDHDHENGQRLYAADAIAESAANVAAVAGARAAGTHVRHEWVQHSSFNGGQELDAAGDMKVNHGYLQRLSNWSGHYEPDGRSNLQALDALDGMGANLDATKVETTVPQGQEKVRDYRALAMLASRNDRAAMNARDDSVAAIDGLGAQLGAGESMTKHLQAPSPAERRQRGAAGPAAAVPWYVSEIKEKGWTSAAAEKKRAQEELAEPFSD